MSLLPVFLFVLCCIYSPTFPRHCGVSTDTGSYDRFRSPAAARRQRGVCRRPPSLPRLRFDARSGYMPRPDLRTRDLRA
ncbi:hypothetical protein B0H14DRAFT_2823452 [Mycena olivaceomarginata]|nr:hypothetical protein B0H14DRAFT_2823452 [Mycena olivaceomarginata]